jgi:D-inositol-3-phosphate glycosyltransferase
MATEREASPGIPSGLRVALIGTGAIEIPPRAYGAVEDYIANLARELTNLGHRVTILNRQPDVRSRRAREVLSAIDLPSELRRQTFDILHAHSPITAEALALAGFDYVFTSHSRYWLTPAKGLDRVWRARDRAAVRRASGVIALSPTVAPIFTRLRGPRAKGPVRVIPFGVDTERFRPPAEGFPRSGIVGLGVVAPHKRWDIFASAARVARVPATIIGGIADERTREKVRSINPEVRFAGEVGREELPEELGRALVYVHPSDMELASVATVQALACGLPVVGSDLLRDIVTPGTEGFLVDHTRPFDERVAETARGITDLISDAARWRSMSARARATAEDVHSWGRIARQVSEFYSEVRAGAPRA